MAVAVKYCWSRMLRVYIHCAADVLRFCIHETAVQPILLCIWQSNLWLIYQTGFYSLKVVAHSHAHSQAEQLTSHLLIWLFTWQCWRNRLYDAEARLLFARCIVVCTCWPFCWLWLIKRGTYSQFWRCCFVFLLRQLSATTASLQVLTFQCKLLMCIFINLWFDKLSTFFQFAVRIRYNVSGNTT